MAQPVKEPSKVAVLTKKDYEEPKPPKDTTPGWIKKALQDGESYVRRIYPHWSGTFLQFVFFTIVFVVAHLVIFYIACIENWLNIGTWANTALWFIPYYEETVTVPLVPHIPIFTTYFGGTHLITSRQAVLFVFFWVFWWLLFVVGNFWQFARHSMFLTTMKLCGRKGWLNPKDTWIPFRMVEALTISRSIWQRIWGTGSVKIFTESIDEPTFKLKNVKNPIQLASFLRTQGARINPA